MKYIKKLLRTVVFSMFLVMVLPTLAFAEESQDVQASGEGGIDETLVNHDKKSEYADNIVKIVTVYEDEEGNVYTVKQGTGFIIGVGSGTSENSNKKYIVSDYGIVEGEKSYVDSVKDIFNLSSDVRLSIKYYAVGDMGVLSELKIISYSDETRYVIMEPSTAMADKSVLRLGDGTDIRQQTRVHVEGYNGKRDVLKEEKVGDRSIIVYDTGIINVREEKYYNDTIVYFTVGEPISSGMAGSPVIDQNGCVIGMFILRSGETKPQVMSIDNIRQVLDALAINYMVASDDTTYDRPTELQKRQLKDLIVENKDYISSINKNFYTATTWNALYDAIEKADDVYMSSKSTAKQYDDNIAALKKARKKMKTKAFKWKLINVIAAIVIFVILIILTKTLKKRKYLRAQRKIISDMGK